MSYGWEEYGVDTFGQANWGKAVTLKSLPEIYRRENPEKLEQLTAGLTEFLNQLKKYADLYLNLFTPRMIRKDLLEIMASNFGITKETRWTDEFLMYLIEAIPHISRMKGRVKSIETILRVAGFNAIVNDLYEVEAKTGDPPSNFRVICGGGLKVGPNKFLEETITFLVGEGAWKTWDELVVWRETYPGRKYYPLRYLRIIVNDYPGRRTEWELAAIKMFLRLVRMTKPCIASIVELIVRSTFEDKIDFGDNYQYEIV